MMIHQRIQFAITVYVAFLVTLVLCMTVLSSFCFNSVTKEPSETALLNKSFYKSV